MNDDCIPSSFLGLAYNRTNPLLNFPRPKSASIAPIISRKNHSVVQVDDYHLVALLSSGSPYGIIMANASTEQKELDLVEKVDFKILHVANDETKLNQLLKVYLPPLLLKGGSEHESVRNKVITIAKRLMTFIQSPGYDHLPLFPMLGCILLLAKSG